MRSGRSLHAYPSCPHWVRTAREPQPCLTARPKRLRHGPAVGSPAREYMHRRFGLPSVRVPCKVVQAEESQLRKNLALRGSKAPMSIAIKGPIPGPPIDRTTRSSSRTTRSSGLATGRT